jgi:hypothetical protein
MQRPYGYIDDWSYASVIHIADVGKGVACPYAALRDASRKPPCPKSGQQL